MIELISSPPVFRRGGPLAGRGGNYLFLIFLSVLSEKIILITTPKIYTQGSVNLFPLLKTGGELKYYNKNAQHQNHKII